MTAIDDLDAATQVEIEAAVLRRLISHLDENKDVQNIDLMNLAGFCRNCLSKWYVAEAETRGAAVDYEAARERVDASGLVLEAIFVFLKILETQ